MSLVPQAGFTLIEMLVVMVIIGVIISMTTLSIGVLGRDSEIDEQAHRLHAVITQVREEAEMQGRDIGVLIERDGYEFMRYDYPTQTWQQIDSDALLLYRKLPAGLEARLWLEGREIVLKTHAQNQSSLARSHSSSSSSSAGPGLTDKTHSNPQVPQIAILSSGDLSPFELRIQREGNDFSWRLLSKDDNTLLVEVTDAAH